MNFLIVYIISIVILYILNEIETKNRYTKAVKVLDIIGSAKISIKQYKKNKDPKMIEFIKKHYWNKH